MTPYPRLPLYLGYLAILAASAAHFYVLHHHGGGWYAFATRGVFSVVFYLPMLWHLGYAGWLAKSGRGNWKRFIWLDISWLIVFLLQAGIAWHIFSDGDFPRKMFQ